MIEFNCPNRKYDGTPVVCDLEVMAYAEAQVGDYKPELLRTPGKINALHFVESYLNAAVDVQDILNVVPGMEINGITVFKDAMITVREEGGYVSKLFPAGAIIIDQTVIGREDGFEQFTIVHEGGHFCMHYPAFCGQDILAARSVMDKIMCRSNVLENDRQENRRWTDRDFMEQLLRQPQRAQPAADRAAQDNAVKQKDAQHIPPGPVTGGGQCVLNGPQRACPDRAGAGIAVQAGHAGVFRLTLINLAADKAFQVSVVQQRRIQLNQSAGGRPASLSKVFFRFIQGQYTPYRC